MWGPKKFSFQKDKMGTGRPPTNHSSKEYFIPIICILLVGTSIEVAGRCIIVHHREELDVWTGLAQSGDKQTCYRK